MNILRITANDIDDENDQWLLDHKSKEYVDGGYTHLQYGEDIMTAEVVLFENTIGVCIGEILLNV